MGHNGQKVWQHTLSAYLGIEAHVQPPLASGSLGHHQDVTWVVQKCVCVCVGRLFLAPSEPTRVLQERVWGRHLWRYGHRMSLEGSGEAVVCGL